MTPRLETRPSDPPAEPAGPPRRWRRWLVAVLLLLAIFLALRQLPRRLAVVLLEQTLGAEVGLDRVVFEGWDRLRLEGLTLRRPEILPPVVELRAGSLVITAKLGELLDRHVRRLALDDAVLQLEPAPWPEATGPSLLLYDQLDPGALRVVVGSGEMADGQRGSEEVAQAMVHGLLHDSGSGPRGRLELEAGVLPLRPLLALARGLAGTGPLVPPTDGETDDQPGGELGEVRGWLELGDDGLEASADLARLLLTGPEARLDATGGHLALHQRADGMALEATTLDARLSLDPSVSAGSQGLSQARFEWPAIELETSLDGVPSRLLLQATTLELRRADGQRLAHGTAPRLELSPTTETPRTGQRLVGMLSAERLELAEPWTPAGAISRSAVGAVIDGSRIELELGIDGTAYRLAAVPHLPGLARARLQLEWAMDQGLGAEPPDLQTLAAEWQGLRLERWLPLLDRRLSEVTGSCSGALAVGAASLALELVVEEAGGQVATDSGPLTLPPSLFPLELELDSARPGSSPSLAGSADLRTPLGQLTFGGRLSVDQTPALEPASPRLEGSWRWQGPSLGELRPRLAGLGLVIDPALELAGRLRAKGQIAGTLAAPRVVASLSLEELEMTVTGETMSVTLAEAKASVDLVWRASGALAIDRLSLGGQLEAPGLHALPLTLTARGGLGVDRRLTLADATLTLPGAHANLVGDAALATGLDGWRSWSGHLTLSELDLSTWLAALDPAPSLLEGYQLHGGGRLELTLSPAGGPPSTPLPSGEPSLSGTLSLSGLGFSSADGGRVLEALGAELELALRRTDEPLAGSAWQLTAKGRTSGFLLLWNTLYADFSTAAPGLVLVASIPEARDRPKALSLQALLQPESASSPSLELVVSEATPGDPHGLPWRLSLVADDLDLLHRQLLLPALGEERVGETLAGKLHARLAGAFDDTEHWRASGEVKIDDLAWRSAGWRIAGLDARLPIDLEHTGAVISGSRGVGQLAFDQLAGGGFVLPALDTGLWLEGDDLGLDGLLSLPLYGGLVVVERVTLTDLLGEQPALLVGLRLEGLQLAEISRAYDLLPLEGTLDGQLPRLRLAGSELLVDGGGEVRLFGGVVRVHGITGRDILSPFPRLILSAELADIDLGQLTRKIDFGEMTGVLQGEVRDCELFRGVPVTCQARFETVERRGVRRTVDVKAVNNLTILGTGQGNLFDRGLRRFFKRFTYDRLVLAVELADDRLLLRGQPAGHGREVFLSGRLPFPIEVVNAQPGRQVSFQAMRSRLDSLDFDLATTGPKPPGP